MVPGKRWAAVLVALAWLLSAAGLEGQSAPAYSYFRAGNPADVPFAGRAGFALMGGGTDLDQAFRWLCARSGGGDFLVLRAAGGDDYNAYLEGLCRENSVATLVIPSRAAAGDPFVVRRIGEASALFIAGGDQANYINFWQGTPVEKALNKAIRRGVPLGGTSAGLAVLGEYAYTAQGDKPEDADLDSKTALGNPYHERITLEHGFLSIPLLNDTITDTHFVKRDRMGRLLVFLARLNEPDGKPVPPGAPTCRGIGVDEGVAVLLEADGRARVVGRGSAYFVDARHAWGVMAGGKFGVMALGEPLTFGPYDVQRVMPGHTFNLKSWTGVGTRYALTVKRGKVRSTQTGGAVY